MINIKKLDNKDIYTVTVDEKLNQQDVEHFYSLLEEKAKEKPPLKVMLTFTEFPGLQDFATFGKVVKMKVEALQGIAKYAIVTNKEWIQSIMPVADFFTPGTPVQAFHLDEREKAITWLDKIEDKAVPGE